MSDSLVLPRSRRRRIRPPGFHWWRALMMVSLGLLALALHVFKGNVNIYVGVSAASWCLAIFVYWPDLRDPYKPHRSPVDPLHTAVLVAMLTSIGTGVIVP